MVNCVWCPPAASQRERGGPPERIWVRVGRDRRRAQTRPHSTATRVFAPREAKERSRTDRHQPLPHSTNDQECGRPSLRVAAMAFRFRFCRIGGLDQVALDGGADLAHLHELDQKLWVALSCPVKGLELEERTLELLDLDK